MSKLQVGIVGAGGIAVKLHLPEMQTVSDAEVAVVSGRRISRLETICRKFDVPRWTQSYEEVIADERLDAVIISLPHPLHVECVRGRTVSSNDLQQRPDRPVRHFELVGSIVHFRPCRIPDDDAGHRWGGHQNRGPRP